MCIGTLWQARYYTSISANVCVALWMRQDAQQFARGMCIFLSSHVLLSRRHTRTRICFCEHECASHTYTLSPTHLHTYTHTYTYTYTYTHTHTHTNRAQTYTPLSQHLAQERRSAIWISSLLLMHPRLPASPLRAPAQRAVTR